MMTGMILAAGRGTRMKHITEQIPKALVEVGGRTMLERTAVRLIQAGVTRLVINVHHHADQIRQFVQDRNGFGAQVLISDESDALLDTGGALKRAAELIGRDAGPFVLHNVDVLTDIDLGGLYRAHTASGALATLAVMRRDSSRYLLASPAGDLCGRGNRAAGTQECPVGSVREATPVGFCGIHIISPQIFGLMPEAEAFPLIDLYMQLLGRGYRIATQNVDGALWMDIGSPERLERARGLMG